MAKKDTKSIEASFNEGCGIKKKDKRYNPWGNSKKNSTNSSQTTGP